MRIFTRRARRHRGTFMGCPSLWLLASIPSAFTPSPPKPGTSGKSTLNPAFPPENLFLIGVRSYEPPEDQILQKYLSQTTFTSEFIHKNGMSPVLEALRKRLQSHSSALC
jgi:arginase family enzyme